MRHVLFVALMFTALGCGKSEGEEWCECVVDNDCWATDPCNQDPLGSCLWREADEDAPAYAEGDESKVCYAVLTDCAAEKCGASPSN